MKKNKLIQNKKTKEKRELKQWQKRAQFYLKQVAKALIILIVVYMPIDVINNLINNLALTLADQTNVSYFADSAKLNYMTTIASGIFLLGIYAIFFRINWSFDKYQIQKTEKEARK